jgi:hypothetical protein
VIPALRRTRQRKITQGQDNTGKNQAKRQFHAKSSTVGLITSKIRFQKRRLSGHPARPGVVLFPIAQSRK